MPIESTEPKPSISAYLKSLGDTTTQIYLNLHSRGIRGRGKLMKRTVDKKGGP